jgi:hypothetical protein
MRQVNRDELIYQISAAMKGITPSIWKLITHPNAQQRDKGLVIVAGIIADSMARLEVLSSAPEASPGAFSIPVARMMGEYSGTGAPDRQQG